MPVGPIGDVRGAAAWLRYDLSVAAVRSTQKGPLPPQPEYDEHAYFDREAEDWEERWSLSREAEAYEESLPAPDDDYEYSWINDEYTELWERGGAWDRPVDDAAVWERAVQSPCIRCGARADLDPMETCPECRAADGRCSWCGLDAIVYETDEACRTCYQRLRRAGRVTWDLALRLTMLDAAFARADQRKQRKQRNGTSI